MGVEFNYVVIGGQKEAMPIFYPLLLLMNKCKCSPIISPKILSSLSEVKKKKRNVKISPKTPLILMFTRKLGVKVYCYLT